MLSRVADALFWMSRYLERAEHVTRLLDVWFFVELDLRAVAPGSRERHWQNLATILQHPAPSADEAWAHEQITQRLIFDLDNPASIMSCVSRARSNARSVRGSINSEVWRALNKLYWQLCESEFRAQALESPHEFFQAVESGSQLFHGACDATLDHDEGWQFIQLGKFLERAEKTLRILGVPYRGAAESAEDLPLSNVQWASVLKTCRAYEAYQRLYVGRVEPERVVEFLLLHPTSPRSVRFSLEAAAQSLTAVGGTSGRAKAERLLGRVLSDLKFIELEQLLREDLHGFLGGVLARCAEVGRSVQEHYSLH
ncbi:MAG: alpha-E domain-containing protein [Candidatus Binatia bacterium]|jgi:uncharacterized alpha-E superfamily protein